MLGFEKTLRQVILTLLVILLHLLSCSGNARNMFYFLAESCIIHIFVIAGCQLLRLNDNSSTILKRRSADLKTKLILTCSMTSLVRIVRISASLTMQYAPLVFPVSKSAIRGFLRAGIRSFLILLLPSQLLFGSLCLVALSQLVCVTEGLYRLVFYMAGYYFRALTTTLRLGLGVLSTSFQACKFILKVACSYGTHLLPEALDIDKSLPATGLGAAGESFVLLMDNLHWALVRLIPDLSWMEMDLAKFFPSATHRMYFRLNRFIRYISPTKSYTEGRIQPTMPITKAKELFACTLELARNTVEDYARWTQSLLFSTLRHYTLPFFFAGPPYLLVKASSLPFGNASIPGAVTPNVPSFAKVFFVTFVGILVVISGYSTVLRICRTAFGSRRHGVLSRSGPKMRSKDLQPFKGPDFDDADDHYTPDTALSTNDPRTQTLTVVDELGFHMDDEKLPEPEGTQELRLCSPSANSVVSEVPHFGEQRRLRKLTGLTSEAPPETDTDSSSIKKSLRVDARLSDGLEPEEENLTAAKCAAAVPPRYITREAHRLKHAEDADPYVMQIKEYEEKIQLIEEAVATIFVDHNDGSGEKTATAVGLTPTCLFYLTRGLENARLYLARSEADVQGAAYSWSRDTSQHLYKVRTRRGAYSALNKLCEGDLDLVDFLDLEPDSECSDPPHALLLPIPPFRAELETEVQTLDLARRPVSDTIPGAGSVGIGAESEPADRLGGVPSSSNFSNDRGRGLQFMRPADQEGVRLASMAIYRELIRKGISDVMAG